MADRKLHPDPTTAEELFEEEVAELEQPLLHSWLPWAVAAGAIVLLACILALFFIVEPRMAKSRGPVTAAGLRVLNLAEPIGRIKNPPVKFRWDPIPNAAVYIVSVTEEDSARPILVRPVEEVEVQPTDTEISLFKPGLYTWEVEARLRDGTPLATGEGAFVIESPPRM